MGHAAEAKAPGAISFDRMRAGQKAGVLKLAHGRPWIRERGLHQEIATRHSSLGGECGERVDPVKDASFARAGAAGASHP